MIRTYPIHPGIWDITPAHYWLLNGEKSKAVYAVTAHRRTRGYIVWDGEQWGIFDLEHVRLNKNDNLDMRPNLALTGPRGRDTAIRLLLSRTNKNGCINRGTGG